LINFLLKTESAFSIFGKKIFYAITAFYWAVFFFGENLGFELAKVPNNYGYVVSGIGLLSTFLVFVDAVAFVWNFIKKFCEYSYAEKERKEYYFKAIKTIQRYGDVDGLGILLSLLSFPSRGDHWQKGIPQNCQKNDVYTMLQLFSEVTVGKRYYNKVLTFYSNLGHFDFDKGFFEFLEEEYFVKNKHEKIDLSSNFMRSR
jgi:hypothetical protein